MLELFNKLTTLPEIESFIQGASADTDTEARENSNIEYKEANQKFSNTKKDEIGKDVSAFANSEGGLIFYGVKCDRSDRTKPQTITGLELENIETFDRVVNSTIHYPIKGIQKKLIPNESPKVMLVYVPQSDESPHQSVGNKYYIRLGSESRAMPHYLVELHFGKRRRPKINVKCDRISKPVISSFDENFSPLRQLNVSLENSGKAIAKHVRAVLIFPRKFIKEDLRLVTGSGEQYPHVQNISDLFLPEQRVWDYTNNEDVIHPRTNLYIARFQFQFHRQLFLEPDTEESNPIFEWTTYSEGMEPQTGKVMLSSLFLPTNFQRTRSE